MSGRITTIEDARMELQAAIMDTEADFGEEAVEAGYRDLVYVVANECTAEVRSELLRMEGFGGSW